MTGNNYVDDIFWRIFDIMSKNTNNNKQRKRKVKLIKRWIMLVCRISNTKKNKQLKQRIKELEEC